MLSVKSIGAMLAAATFGTALLTVTAETAAAQSGYHGGWGGGTRYVNRSYGYRGGYAARGVVARGYGYRGAYVARGYGYRGYGYRRGWNTGGAVAAGVVGGLALGAIAASASSYPAYGYGSGYGYAPAYSYAAPSYGYAAPTSGYAAQTYYAPRHVVATNACGYVQRRAWIEGEGWRRFTRYECDY
ncbi:MAG: hypothetical protein ACOYOJ_12520 [Alsobacter sp.]